MFTTTRSGRFIPIKLTKSHRFVGTIRVPGGAEKGEVKYTEVVMAIVKRKGTGSMFTLTVYRRVTGVTSMVAIAPSTKTATTDAVKHIVVKVMRGSSVLKASMTKLVTTDDIFAPLNVADTGSTVVKSMTAR